MSENFEKLVRDSARVSDTLEAKTDYYGAKLLAWPYSWAVVAVVVGLAAWKVVGFF